MLGANSSGVLGGWPHPPAKVGVRVEVRAGINPRMLTSTGCEPNPLTNDDGPVSFVQLALVLTSVVLGCPSPWRPDQRVPIEQTPELENLLTGGGDGSRGGDMTQGDWANQPEVIGPIEDGQARLIHRELFRNGLAWGGVLTSGGTWAVRRCPKGAKLAGKGGIVHVKNQPCWVIETRFPLDSGPFLKTIQTFKPLPIPKQIP